MQLINTWEKIKYIAKLDNKLSTCEILKVKTNA